MNLDTYLQDSENNNNNNNNNNDSENNNNNNNNNTRVRSNTIGETSTVNGHKEKIVDEELGVEYTEDELSEAMEAIELPNIQDRMKMFQGSNKSGESPYVKMRKPKSRAINRKQRPKSYAGEFLSQMVFENGIFREKDEHTLTNNEVGGGGERGMVDRNSAADLGKALM